jgi:hypothetical protein
VMMLAAAPVVSSCANRAETQLKFPPVADIKPDAEPAYPDAALEPCPTNLRSDPCPAADAERAWWGSMIEWGRTHHGRVERICRWARELKARLPTPDYCGTD